jgi:ribosomal protein S18 acetylase RimI-like enzyme
MKTPHAMSVSARLATREDLTELIRMYDALATEQGAIRAIWPAASGLPAPFDTALGGLIGNDNAVAVVGMIDDVPVGFLLALGEPLAAPREDERIGSIRLIFTDHEARGVGVGAAMLDLAESELRQRGVTLFDAHVSPGHRLAKNFFESHGFKAREITMHRSDEHVGQ